MVPWWHSYVWFKAYKKEGQKTVLQMVRTMWAADGLRGFYRGVNPGLTGSLATGATDFGFIESTKSWLEVSHPSPGGHWAHFLARGVVAHMQFKGKAGHLSAIHGHHCLPELFRIAIASQRCYRTYCYQVIKTKISHLLKNLVWKHEDGETGDVVGNLGKLAPIVEKTVWIWDAAPRNGGGMAYNYKATMHQFCHYFHFSPSYCNFELSDN